MTQDNSAKPDEQRGIYRKYEVRRLGDEVGKHSGCEYFVLDLTHDKFSVPALIAYGNACASEFPMLAKDITFKVHGVENPPKDDSAKIREAAEAMYRLISNNRFAFNDAETEQTRALTLALAAGIGGKEA